MGKVNVVIVKTFIRAYLKRKSCTKSPQMV